MVSPGSLFMGHPGKFRRALTPEDLASIDARMQRAMWSRPRPTVEPMPPSAGGGDRALARRASRRARKFQAIKGVRDILPPESALWNRVEQTAREVFATYGYGEIRLPIFEPTELFARSIGSNDTEMYRSKRDVRRSAVLVA